MKSIPRILISGLIVTALLSACNGNHEARVAEQGIPDNSQTAPADPARRHGPGFRTVICKDRRYEIQGKKCG